MAVITKQTVEGMIEDAAWPEDMVENIEIGNNSSHMPLCPNIMTDGNIMKLVWELP